MRRLGGRVFPELPAVHSKKFRAQSAKRLHSIWPHATSIASTHPVEGAADEHEVTNIVGLQVQTRVSHRSKEESRKAAKLHSFDQRLAWQAYLCNKKGGTMMGCCEPAGRTAKGRAREAHGTL